tara:strand:+ start:1437 stop:2012 length:576 start_codon:yes stop_codon:yes gene_type:complete
MYKTFANLILHNQVSFEKGKMSLLGQPIAILPIEEYYYMQRILEKKGLENIIYYSAKESGILWLDNMIPKFKMKLNDVVKWGIEILSISGWGNLKLKLIDKTNNKMIFNLSEATIAKKYGTHSSSVDHLLRGYVAAAGTKFLGIDVDAIEHKCVAKGDSYCQYIIKPKKDFDQSSPIVKIQLKKDFDTAIY